MMIKKITAISFFCLGSTFNASAHDANRILQLEQDIQLINLRLTKLESAQGIKTDTQKPLANSDGWKSLANWRQLTTGMTPIDVRGLLGEPQRVDGGNIAYWYYPNRGSVSFFLDKLNGWQEPK